MADSRIAAMQQYLEHAWPLGRKLTWLIVCFLGAAGLTWLLHDPNFTVSQSYTLFILLFAVGLWFSEAIPPFAVGVLIIFFLVYALGGEYLNPDPSDVRKYVNTWSSSVIWLMLGGFFLAEGMQRTELDKGLFKLTVNIFGTQPRLILLGMMLTTAFSSMIMSNTATTAMMIAAVTPFVKSLSEEAPIRKAILLGIPAAAALGGMGTIIGSPPNAIAVGALSSVGIEVDFVTWMAFGVPLALTGVAGFWFVLIRTFKFQVSEVVIDLGGDGHALNFYEKRARIVVGLTLLLTMALWMSSPLHGISAAAVSGLPIMALTVTGVIGSKDVRGLPWDTLMLVAGGLSLGAAIVETGLAEYFVGMVDLTGVSSIAVLLLFGYMTMLFSNIMSNTATATILVPIAAILMKDAPYAAAMVIGLCASTALFLPVSTPPNAIAFATGFLRQSDFRLGGAAVGLAMPVLIVLWVMLLA